MNGSIFWILNVIGTWLIGQILNKMFINEKSPLYYENIMEWLKAFLYSPKIITLIVFYSVLTKLGLGKLFKEDKLMLLSFALLGVAIRRTLA